MIPAWFEQELAVAALCEQITDNGMPFDRAAGETLRGLLTLDQTVAFETLQKAMAPKKRTVMFIPKRNNKTKGYIKDVPFPKVSYEAFNPNSPAHVAEWLHDLHGWTSAYTTETGKPQVTTQILAMLPYPEAQQIVDYRMVAKRLTMLASERNGTPGGYINVVADDGAIHTSYSTLGTLSGRCSHAPNIAQVPKVIYDKDGQPVLGLAGKYGHEFRSLFTAPPDWWLVGADLASIELRIFAHHLVPYDNGYYVQLVTQGDAHAENAQNAGISRAAAKTLIYACIYGCGSLRAGTIVDPTADDQFHIRAIGKQAKAALIAGITGMDALFQQVEHEAVTYGYLMGLDGRLLQVRRTNAALNLKIQSAGAVIAKKWLTLIDQHLRALDFDHGLDYRIQAFIHDEIVIGARTQEIAAVVASVCEQAARDAGDFYRLQCPVAASAKIGRRWSDTH